MAAYIDKIRCFDCDATLIRKLLQQHYLRQYENKPPKFRWISTAAIQSFFKNGSEKRTNSEIDQDEEQSSSQDCPNFKRSKPDILGNEEEEIIPEQTDTTKITIEIPDSLESPSPGVTELLQKLMTQFSSWNNL
ncbi:hypothetical protein AVEN_241351-1 [Araneus ventricosus]|uniref:Uncharacterized protein n=1 Tax=Araneus ventricosus TaxID=182803 RepID=A0A4Y2Q0H5_ARAVE|nr:hypothetical protein AVEN_241351-1 [Araneus ventricosus]